MRIQTRHSHLRGVLRAIEFVIHLQDGPAPVAQLADVAGFSQHHFSRLFLKATGEPPHKFVNRVRMERAAYNLQRTSVAIQAVAGQAGYSGPEAFCRAFGTYFGVAPSEFRRTEEPWQLASHSGFHWIPSGWPKGIDAVGVIEDRFCVFDKPSVKVAAIRRVGTYRNMGRWWSELMHKLGPASNRGARFLAIFHDDFFSAPHEDQLRSDLGFILEEGLVVPEGFRSFRLPAGVYVSPTQRTDATDYGQKWWDFRNEWIPLRGKRPLNFPVYDDYESLPRDWSTVRWRPTIGLDLELGDPDLL